MKFEYEKEIDSLKQQLAQAKAQNATMVRVSQQYVDELAQVTQERDECRKWYDEGQAAANAAGLICSNAEAITQLEADRDALQTAYTNIKGELHNTLEHCQALQAEHAAFVKDHCAEVDALQARLTAMEEALRLMLQAFDPQWPGACAQDCFDTSDGHGYEMQEMAKQHAQDALAQKEKA